LTLIVTYIQHFTLIHWKFTIRPYYHLQIVYVFWIFIFYKVV